jgi:four helix bundle protein
VKKLPKTYKDLEFWKSSFKVATLVVNLTRRLPRSLEIRIILNQLFRSSMSIGANIAEGYGRFGGKEYARFLQVSLGSANETEYWLILLKECCPRYRKEIDKIIEKNSETIKMLASSIKTIKSKKK